jgi:hypothetical protein
MPENIGDEKSVTNNAIANQADLSFDSEQGGQG